MACVLALAAGPAHAAGWIASWAAPPAPAMTGGNANFASISLTNQTVAQVARLSAGGQRLRIRLTNEYGAKPLTVGAVRVALVGADGKPDPKTDRVVTFGGQGRAVIPPHAPLVSDPVDLPTMALQQVRIVAFYPEATGPCGCHARGEALAEISAPGDFTAQPFTPAATTQNRVFLSGVDVEAAARQPVIVAFGDSITDGYQSTVGANRRWPDVLAERLKGRAAVVNDGISGNRVLSDGAIPTFGESALTRFDRDVLALPGATHLVVLEGINDLGGRPNPTAEQLIAGYRQLIARAHAHGLKVILATLIPYGGANYFRPEGEAERRKVNAWIRKGRGFDGVIDFDAAIRDPARPERMQAALQSGDWLHPNDAGYRKMADSIDLNLFR
jgi:lysophospholipase L1-like esterase